MIYKKLKVYNEQLYYNTIILYNYNIILIKSNIFISNIKSK